MSDENPSYLMLVTPLSEESQGRTADELADDLVTTTNGAVGFTPVDYRALFVDENLLQYIIDAIDVWALLDSGVIAEKSKS